MPSPKTQLQAVVTRLIDDEAIPARLLALGDAAAILMLADESLTALFTPAFGPAEVLQERLRVIVEENPGVHVKIAIIGGEPELRELLPKGGGMLARRAVQLFHLGPGDDGWSVWTGGGARLDSPLGRALDAAARGELPAPDGEALAQRVDAPAELSPQERARLSEGQAFIKSLQARPTVTWGILGFLAVVFGVELLWGGSESIPTLVRMGANTEATLTGEPWRLLSSALLHAGVVHIAVNGYVLLMLGGFMEKVLGGARYGVLLGGAALGGGLGSALLSGLVSVGASGAIWGVLGAAAALALRPGDVIPQMLVAPLRRNAVINLGLGLAISFLPQVDMWAHLGGGAAGAALVWSGLLTRGLRPIGSEPEDEAESVPRGRGWTIAAGVVGGAMVASLVTAWVTDRPWRLVRELEWTEVDLGHGVIVEAPALLAEDRVSVPEDDSVISKIGDGNRSPMEIVAQVAPHELSEADLAHVTTQEPTLKDFALPPNSRVVKDLTRRKAPWPTFELEYALGEAQDSEVQVFTIWTQLRPHLQLRIESVRRPWIDDRWANALQRVYASLEEDEARGDAVAPPPSPASETTIE